MGQTSRDNSPSRSLQQNASSNLNDDSVDMVIAAGTNHFKAAALTKSKTSTSSSPRPHVRIASPSSPNRGNSHSENNNNNNSGTRAQPQPQSPGVGHRYGQSNPEHPAAQTPLQAQRPNAYTHLPPMSPVQLPHSPQTQSHQVLNLNPDVEPTDRSFDLENSFRKLQVHSACVNFLEHQFGFKFNRAKQRVLSSCNRLNKDMEYTYQRRLGQGISIQPLGGALENANNEAAAQLQDLQNRTMALGASKSGHSTSSDGNLGYRNQNLRSQKVNQARRYNHNASVQRMRRNLKQSKSCEALGFLRPGKIA